jgi:signal transduction histidine kinase
MKNPANNYGPEDITRHESSPESDGQHNATIIHLTESINQLKIVNKDLSTKHGKQKEFISIAAHELRSPIMPILGMLEYEFREAKKVKLHLKKSDSKPYFVMPQD